MTDKSQSLVALAPDGLARLNVEALIQQALENKAGVEQLHGLYQLAKDIRAEQAREAYNLAMADFQRTVPPIKKTASARIVTSRANYSYSYAPLDEILSTIQRVMGPLGLSISWRSSVGTNTVIVNCRVAHKYGHHEESGEIAMPISTGDDRGANAAQRVAIAMTYAKRYTLLGIIGMAPEDDDDGAVRAAVPVEPSPRESRPTAARMDADLRDPLLAQIKEVADAAGWDDTARKKLWQEHFGDAKPTTVDPAALADFLAEVRRLTS